jgi:hypothetical protein
MSLDKFAGGGKPPKKASKPPVDTGPDRDKIERLKKILQQSNVQAADSKRLGHEQPAPPPAGVGDETDFLAGLEHFADWIRGRTYLRGDVATAKQMIVNLVKLDPSLAGGSVDREKRADFADIGEFLKEVKTWESLHPDQLILTKQQHAALQKRKRGDSMTSTDYRHLKALKDEVRGELKKLAFYEFLATFLDLPEGW